MDDRISNRRNSKRIREIKMIIENVESMFSDHTGQYPQKKILEFGCGQGYQIFYLKTLGHVTACDIYESDGIRQQQGIDFQLCAASSLPFLDKTFDIVFSNHVLEHVENLDIAFKELIRIGTDNCLYIFSLPTPFWLLLSLPHQYHSKLFLLWRKIKSMGSKKYASKKKIDQERSGAKNSNQLLSLFNQICIMLFPEGHGVYSNFISAFFAFHRVSWLDKFRKAGFHPMKDVPLLLYGPSEFPLIEATTRFNRLNICSSRAFFLSKNTG